MLKLIPESDILQIEEDQQAALDRFLDSQIAQREEAWRDKQEWLAVFERTLSPKLACKRTDVSIDRYRRWRKTCPQFCRAFNEIVTDASDEMLGSAISRATGYLVADAETESGFQEDAAGTPIRHGASDSALKALINSAGAREQNNHAPVQININFGALGVGEETARLVADKHSHIAIDGEVVSTSTPDTADP